MFTPPYINEIEEHFLDHTTYKKHDFDPNQAIKDDVSFIANFLRSIYGINSQTRNQYTTGAWTYFTVLLPLKVYKINITTWPILSASHRTTNQLSDSWNQLSTTSCRKHCHYTLARLNISYSFPSGYLCCHMILIKYTTIIRHRIVLHYMKSPLCITSYSTFFPQLYQLGISVSIKRKRFTLKKKKHIPYALVHANYH